MTITAIQPTRLTGADPLPRGTCLGKQNPDCAATLHGTYSAYRSGCRCPKAREAWRLYYKRHREGRAQPRLLDATGTRRRIQALWAIGHASTTIGYAAGDLSGCNVQRLATRNLVSRASADAIRLAFNRLSLHAGTSAVTRKRALDAGYAPPLAWDDDTIDDPAAHPNLGDPGADVIDEVAVRRALDGEHLHLTRAERLHAFRVGLARGMTAAAIGDCLHLSGTRALEIARTIRTTQAA